MSKKSTSRPARWDDACSRLSEAASMARAAIEELQGLKDEYEEWQSNLPENLANSSLGEKLQAVVNLDLDRGVDELDDIVSECEAVELPRGFGND